MVISDEAGRFAPLRLPVQHVLTGPHVEKLPDLARIAADWLKLLGLAGIKSTATLTVDDFWEARWPHIASDLVLHGGGQAKLTVEASALEVDGQPIKALMVHGASIAGEAISYAMELELGPKGGEPSTYVSRTFRPLEVRRAVADIDDYLYQFPLIRTGEPNL
ncbi:MAG: hypothetical protein ACRC67_09455 [Inquilinus sp.]|uniref:hypothetical protein n=1 Tax=Inquilinus sp. TaxID=1932117 RepID=UPI003F3E21B2